MFKLSLRVWILIIALVLALLSIAPWKTLDKGVVIKSIDKNSSEYESGLKTGMVITEINSKPISSLEDYSQAVSSIAITENTRISIKADNQEFILLTGKPLSLAVSSLPKSNLKTGLDLSGGARALVKPANVSLSSSEISDLIAITNERFNSFGLRDLTVRQVRDLQGNNYMLVEIAQATAADLKELVSQQGKFEAKIGEDIVFIGGEKDISSVCRTDATCSRIETCSQLEDSSYACRFSFVIYLSETAAKRQANITSSLGVNITQYERYLDKKLDLYLDNILVDSLFVSEDLKGRVTTEIQISGSGTGASQEEAYNDAKRSMNKLQTILITGSLPYKLEIVKLDTISPFLGKQFTKNIIYLALIVFAIVSVVLFIKYRKIKITLSVILTMFSEAFITLGIAALLRWNLDAPSIAGIIAGMGTGVNDQIVIIDEAVSQNQSLGIKERIKRALFIILGAFFTIIAAMIPLFWAGAGMLRGFALTTIIGVSVGILITRPAFADILKRISS